MVESHAVVTVAAGQTMADRVRGAVGMDESAGLGGFTGRFMEALAEHRHWGREQKGMVPA